MLDHLVGHLAALEVTDEGLVRPSPGPLVAARGAAAGAVLGSRWREGSPLPNVPSGLLEDMAALALTALAVRPAGAA